MTSLSGELCCEALESTTALVLVFYLALLLLKSFLHEVVSPSVIFFSFREGTCLTMLVLY